MTTFVGLTVVHLFCYLSDWTKGKFKVFEKAKISLAKSVDIINKKSKENSCL